MKQKVKLLFLLGIVNCQLSIVNCQEKVVPFSFGDMDHWVVREIHESGIIGGNTKHLYELGPTDTIIGNTAYTNRGGGRRGEDEYFCLPGEAGQRLVRASGDTNGKCEGFRLGRYRSGSRRFRFSRNGARTDQGDQKSAGHVEQWSGVYQEAEGVAF